MSQADSLLTTIDDYLLSIAEGLHRAQAELESPAGVGAQATYSYYVPKLEFELRVTVQMERSKSSSGLERRTLLLRPASPELSSASQAVSVVRGTFVAVPNAARTALRAASSVSWKDGRHGLVAVRVTDGAGAPQPGVEVNFNVDRDLSRKANQEAGATIELSPDTTFVQGVVRTDATGRAESMLSISSKEAIGTVVVLLLDAAGQTETIRHTLVGAS